MRVLVTGAGGFVGRALAPLLLARGHALTANDRAIDAGSLPASARLVPGDITDEAVRRAALRDADAVIHLATIPGAAAEQDPERARRVNVEATLRLSAEFAAQRPAGRFVFASSIAVLGSPLPELVDDATPPAPRMLYGAHKAMAEIWLATLARRGDLAALSLRLPGIVVRPPGPSGMKSAFLSGLFHAVAAGQAITLPVSPMATTWLMSVAQVARNLAHAVELPPAAVPTGAAITLPALHVRIADLADELCRRCGADPALVGYDPDDAVEREFGRFPPLVTAAADGLGFAHDGDAGSLVRAALDTLGPRRTQ